MKACSPRMPSRWWLTPVIVFSLVPLLAGCTAIGFGIGTAVDASGQDRSRCAVANVKPGTFITLHLRDGRRIQGRFRGLLEPDSAGYSVLLEAWGKSALSAGLVPDLGETVSLSSSPVEFSGTFRGLSPAGVRLEPGDSTALHTVRFQEFATLTDSAGRTFGSEMLRQAVESGLVLTGTSIVIVPEVETGTISDFGKPGPRVNVAWDDVVRADVPAPSTGKTIGVLIGAVLDVITIVALANAYASSMVFFYPY